MSSTFWLALSFFTFIALVFRPIKRALLGMLDSHSGAIKAQLDEAKALREEAQKIVAAAKLSQREAQEAADALVEQAKLESERLREHALVRFEAEMQEREQAAVARIKMAETLAREEARARAVDITLSALNAILNDKSTDAAFQKTSVEQALASIKAA